jgi:kynurenine formamidase
VVDLTHPLPPDFPTFFGEPGLEMETLTTWAENKFNMFRWHMKEHTGTHMDAPIHFSEAGETVDQIPVEKLVVPLVVVDIRAKAAEDANAQVTPDDLNAWVAEHGPIPDGACVAMNSGWDKKAKGDEFRNADAEGVMHFPGFHVEAAQWLMEGRNVVGMGVDTLSLDYGQSQDFATHYGWLPTNRWGMECMANLGELPPVGATLVVGGPKIAGATGGPARLIALV